MTRASKSALVLDGSEVKLRLEAERLRTGSLVHVDWVRFTVIRRNAPFLPADMAFPLDAMGDSESHEDFLNRRFARLLRAIPDPEFDAHAQALDLAQTVAAALGSDFVVVPEVRKGHDFYKHRWSVERNGAEVAWVGFLASGDSPRQQSQAATLHANIYGSGCTFAAPGWTERLAVIMEERDADLTRCDLALDMFDGRDGGILRVEQEYDDGLMNAGGKRLICNYVGDWSKSSKGARSFYVGSKEAGKETNVYEKGDQLFGVEAGSCWLRAELRYGNKLRVLPVDMLRRPSDFFAGASDWHAALLAEAQGKFKPEPVKTTPRLALETVEAEVTRVIRWADETAGPTICAVFDFLGIEEFVSLFVNRKRPGRLQKFNASELREGFSRAINRFSAVGVAGPVPA